MKAKISKFVVCLVLLVNGFQIVLADTLNVEFAHKQLANRYMQWEATLIDLIKSETLIAYQDYSCNLISSPLDLSKKEEILFSIGQPNGTNKDSIVKISIEDHLIGIRYGYSFKRNDKFNIEKELKSIGLLFDEPIIPGSSFGSIDIYCWISFKDIVQFDLAWADSLSALGTNMNFIQDNSYNYSLKRLKTSKAENALNQGLEFNDLRTGKDSSLVSYFFDLKNELIKWPSNQFSLYKTGGLKRSISKEKVKEYYTEEFKFGNGRILKKSNFEGPFTGQSSILIIEPKDLKILVPQKGNYYDTYFLNWNEIVLDLAPKDQITMAIMMGR